jgi:hypothetical protein
MEELTIFLPQEVEILSKSVSEIKRNEVKNVLVHVFEGAAKMRTQLDMIEVKDINDKVSMQMADAIRKGVKELRLESEKIFDAKRAEVQSQMIEFKTEDSLWLKAKQTMQILTKETEELAKQKSEFAKRYEAEQLELKIQQRMIRILQFDDNMSRSEFEFMSDASFETFITGIEKAFNDRLETVRLAEETRLAEIEAKRIEDERIRKELAIAQAEAARKEKELEIERKKQAEILATQKVEADKKQKAIEDAARKERELAQAEAAKKQAELKKLQDELAEKEASERRSKLMEEARIKAEQKAKEDAEKKAKAAPDKDKMKLAINSLSLSFDIKNDESKSIAIEITTKFESFKKWAKQQIETL